MDANGLKFWLLAEQAHWLLAEEPPALEYDGSRRSLRLARQRRELRLTEDREQAMDRLATVPQARDLHGNRAWYDPELAAVVAVGVSDTPVTIYQLAGAAHLTDLALGRDGVLYLAVAGTVILHDRRQRWADAVISLAGFTAWRLSPAPDGGVWVLDREGRQLARLRGYPLSSRALKPYTPETIRPCRENADPPRLELLSAVSWPAAETPVALACDQKGRLALLSWQSDGEAVVRTVTAEGALGAPLILLGSRFPYSLCWVESGRLGVLVCGAGDEPLPEPKSEARVYPFEPAGGSRYPCGDLYPLKRDYDLGPFCHGLDDPPHYPAASGSHGLYRLSYPLFTRTGQACHDRRWAPLDSGEVDTVWHRLFLEAAIPSGCGVRIWLAATNEPTAAPELAAEAWCEHRFGARHRQGGRGETPVGHWEPAASELPHHPGLLRCARRPGESGLFSVLIQRPGRRVRALRGRYLQVRVELSGPGNATPELFALRAYGGRFSYVEHYLPRLYWEKVFPPEADEPGAATAADFLERFLANCEGMFTAIEDRVAAADLVTRPQTAPEEALDWLAGWIGFQLEAGWSTEQRRAFLANAFDLYRWHGTLRGLNLALELATGGGVSGGEIVVLEDYRLRRTFATILGADLDDQGDPLTLGGIETGNSFIGDTLLLGDEQRREFLALYAADLSLSGGEQAAIDAFFDRLAFRITILVHQNVEPQDMGMIQRMAEREVPAHVAWRLLPTSAPLLAGITALVGVDTYLSSRPQPQPTRVDRSFIGRGDYVMGPAALDPRLEGMGGGPVVPAAPPVARAEDVTAGYGEEFTLDGSASEAAPGRRLTAYHWTFKDKGETS
ncbi:phage tail protein [Desulfurivibrio sp. D14AmB]|uniref:phage tail protein n=1 Tax=Desulfurivibrio sp. D14AmB TaxID=3374370 RepID=UPI00376F0BC0